MCCSTHRPDVGCFSHTVKHGRAPAGLVDLGAVGRGDEAAEGEPAGRVALRKAGDGRAAGAVERREEGALARDRQPRVLVVQARQQLRRRAVALPARDTDRTLRAAPGI